MHSSRSTEGGIFSGSAIPNKVSAIPALPPSGMTTVSGVLGFRAQETIARSASIPTVGERCRDDDAGNSLVASQITPSPCCSGKSHEARCHAWQNGGMGRPKANAIRSMASVACEPVRELIVFASADSLTVGPSMQKTRPGLFPRLTAVYDACFK